ncbi:MFS transporter [Actinoplanes italicus]|uniref:Putative MFS family arabinose efflux permease n=1 Tax=Actinoplanes italicus TaxID=113567 RepID=A0A2T0K1L2_9ACTN|nr:MFS transporter [Actinoplanes italicus]PRX16455.1 putative MFS family arabinose efflux permease [Actinoplanes italicus]GIE33661.1 MFS transporter [Actinoplanes italicus]
MTDVLVRSPARSWALALMLGSASFLVLFDSLAVATALPAIGDEFGLRPGVLQWVISLYSLSIGAFLVLGGRVCDVWGRRRVMLAGLAVCTGAGLLAGLAPNLPVLLAGRALQGMAAAFALPAALSAAGGEFDTEPWRSRVFSVIAFAAWSAGLAGAMLGGVLTTRLGWRWVFLVTVPVGVIALLGARILLPRDRPGTASGRRLNATSAVLVSSGLVVLLLGLQENSPLLGLGGLALLALMVVVERRSAHPMVNPGLLASRRRAGSYLAFGTYCAGYTALVVIGSLALQERYGLTADAAGLALSPVLVGGAISSTLAPLLMRRFSARTIVVTAMALCALALTLIALSDSVPQLLPWLLLWGLASGPIFVGLTRECISDAPEDDRGTASALFESMSHIGGAIAVAAFMTMLGAGIAFRPVELTGAVVVAAGALLTLLVVPGRRS